MQKFFDIFRREDDCISMGRICALVAFTVWVCGTIYLIIADRSWPGYETLTTGSIGFIIAQVGNKAVECKLFKTDDARPAASVPRTPAENNPGTKGESI